MSRCVPNWDLDDDDGNSRPRLSLHGADLPSDVAELTWENGQLSLHSLGQSRLNSKPATASGTLESLMNQATPSANQAVPIAGCKPSFACGAFHVPWFDPSHAQTDVVAACSAPMMMDALVPCAAAVTNDPRRLAMWPLADSAAHGTGACGCCSAHVGSCSAMGRRDGLLCPAEERRRRQGSRKRMPYDDGCGEQGDHQSVSGSATFSHQATTMDTYERERELENIVSKGSPENMGSRNSSGERVAAANTEEHDSVYSRPRRVGELKRRNGKSSLSTKRSRAAAIHNQSERKRRDKINQRMKTLQKLVPNSSKTDKASVLDEVIDYVKQLQAQVQLMSRTSMMPLSPMMLQLALQQQQQQQQLQLSMMTTPMGLGLGLAGMPGIMAGDMSALGVTGLPNIPGIPPMPVIPPYPFMPMASWDGTLGARFAPVPMTPDPLSAFLSGQSTPNYDQQAMTMDAYSRLAAFYQHQQPSNPNP